jgi:hypothetical protein
VLFSLFFSLAGQGITITWNGTAWVFTNQDSATTSQCIGGSSYSTGSASQAATGIVSGTGGASFPTTVQYGIIYWPASGVASFILAFLSSTSLLVESTTVVSSASYVICYAGVQTASGSLTVTNLLVGQGPASVGGAGVVYSTGTASQSTTTITGIGTRWGLYESVLVGMTIQWSNGASATITGYTSGTSLTASLSQTVAAGSYVILCIPYSAGTAAQNGFAIYGNGTTFTPQMIGSVLAWASGFMAYISNFVSATQLTAAEPQLVANGTFSISSCGSSTYMGYESISSGLNLGVLPTTTGFKGFLNSWTLSGPASGDGITTNPPVISFYGSGVPSAGTTWLSCPVGQMGSYDASNNRMTLLGGMYMDTSGNFYATDGSASNGITMGGGLMSFYYAAASGTCGTSISPTIPLQIIGNIVHLPQLSPTTGILGLNAGAISTSVVAGALGEIVVSGTTISLPSSIQMASPSSYTTGTASTGNVLNTVVQFASATLTADMTGGTLYVGATAGTTNTAYITSILNSTTALLSSSVTIPAASAFTLAYGGVQFAGARATLTGPVYVGTVQSATQVQNAVNLNIFGPASSTTGWQIYGEATNYPSMQALVYGPANNFLTSDAYYDSSVWRYGASSIVPWQFSFLGLSGLAISSGPFGGGSPGASFSWTKGVVFQVGGGVQFLTTNYVSNLGFSTFSVYESTSFPMTFTGPCTTSTVDVVAVRTGDSVTLRIPFASCSSSGAATFTASANLPTRYQPVQNICMPVTVESAGAAVAGSVQLNTAGTLFFYAGIGCAGNFASSGTAGTNNGAASSFSTVLGYPIT